MEASTTAMKVGGGILKEAPLLEGEAVAKEAAAYHRRGAFYLAWGKLFLTNWRLIFCPSKLAGPWRNERLAFPLETIEALGTTKLPWYWTFLLWGMPADAWCVRVEGKRHWFSLGWGTNKLWLRELAERTGLTPRDEN